MNLNATTFDLENARACAAASAAAYKQSTVFAPATDTHVFVLENSDSIIIAFRGTDSIRNWITDADMKRNLLVTDTHEGDCEVHDGFLWAYDSVIQPLSDQLKSLRTATEKKVFITGHSLGGALAKLCALELKRQKFNVAQVYTFGQPRLGNGAFERLYDWSLGECTFRVVYKEDIVPRVPHLALPSDWKWHEAIHPAVLADPYRHGSHEVFISSFDDGELWFDPPLWRLLISDAWGIYRAWQISKFKGAIDPLVCHHVNNYVVALGNAAVPESLLTSAPTNPKTSDAATNQ